MRLTVRTLLAWMDQVLAPDDQRALAEKVEASPVARKLAERARAVVTRGGLGAPQPDGRGLADDPNTAAEFLDNVLAGDRLEAFERVCVESDIHLAEAAACHRLLAEFTREPAAAAAPDAAVRRRILDAVSKQAAVREGAGHGSDAEPVAAAATIAITSLPKPSPPPAVRRRPPVAAWLSAALSLALLLVLGGVLVWSLARGPRGGKQVAGAAPAPADGAVPRPVAPASPAAEASSPPAAAATEVAAPPTAAPPSSPPPAAETPAAPPSPAALASAPPTVEGEPAAPPEPPAAPPMAAPPRPEEERRVPHGDALAIVAPPAAQAPMPEAAKAGDVAAAEPPVEGGPAAVAGSGLVLHRVTAEGASRWSALATGTPLAATEELLAPPWCHPVIKVDGISIRLEPSTRASLRRDADGTPRLELVFGRAVVGGDAADAKIGITAAGLTGVLSGELRQPAGIEVSLDRSPGSDPVTGIARRRAVLFAGAGEKVWRQTAADGSAAAPPLAGIAAEGVVAARAAMIWDDADPAVASLGPPSPEPAWMRGGGSGDRTERAAARALADRLAAGGDVAAALHAMADDRRAEDRLIATATLALMGDYGDLVTLLCAEAPRQRLTEGQWTTLEAMTVPLALARGENAARAFEAAVEAHAPAGKAAAVLMLARGLHGADLAAGGDAMLVEALADESLVMRRYAVRRLLEIVEPEGRQRGAYRADHPAGLRKEAIEWWRSRLEQGQIRRGGEAAGPSAAAP
jgi:hypothetical protein